MLAALNHPNIAAIYGLEGSEGVQALVLEFVEEQTLASRIAQGRIPISEALSIGRQIAEGLEGVHKRGIIHSDLKPANIKLRLDGTVKILDFGLAKAFDPLDASSVTSEKAAFTSSPMSRAGIIFGTAPYMSPEQARGEAVDKRTDIWAFGCVLYETLTGEPAGLKNRVTVWVLSKLAEAQWPKSRRGIAAGRDRRRQTSLTLQFLNEEF